MPVSPLLKKAAILIARGDEVLGVVTWSAPTLSLHATTS